MSAPRTVTVDTSDRGPVTMPEPDWCLGEHLAGGYRADLTHSGREMALTVGTARGPVPLLRACLEMAPFSEVRPAGEVVVTVEIGNDWYPMNPADLDLLGEALAAHAVRLHSMARRLARLREMDS